MIMKSKAKTGFIIGIILIASFSLGWYLYEINKKVSVRIGYLTGDIHHFAYFIAVEKGFFEDEGLKIQGVGFPNGNDVMINYESTQRSIDMAYSGFAPAVLHKMNNEALNITVLAAANVNGSGLIVKNNADIQSVADLVGKTIAVPALNNMQDFILSMILNQSGINRSQITVKQMSVSDMVLDQFKSIDGYVAWEPFCAKGLKDGKGKYLATSGNVWNSHPCCVVSAHNEFIKDHPDIVKKVLAVHKRATMWILENKEEAIQFAMESFHLTEEEAKKAIDNTNYIYSNELTQYIEFVDLLLALNDQASLSKPHLPSGLTSQTFVENYFVNFTLINSL